MNTFLTIALYWDVAMWLIGAVVTTGLLVIAIMAIYHKLFKGWGKKVSKDFRLHLWLYQASRAWEREGNTPPDGRKHMTEEEKLRQALRELLVLAMEHGYVITVENKPRTPLAMGNSYIDFDVRPARHRYQEGGSQ